MTTCRVCGRQLRDPLSIELGCGPICVPRTREKAACAKVRMPTRRPAKPKSLQLCLPFEEEAHEACG
jgi:hypothetical protein